MVNTENIVNRVKKSEQIISMVMGILVVLAIGGLVYRYFQTQQPQTDKQAAKDQQEQQESAENEEGQILNSNLPVTYQVKQGENLWEIAEKFYQSGYNWVDIAEENDLTNPGLLAVGQELTIPDVEPKTATVEQLPETGMAEEDQQITGDRYTVMKGDSLSKIAQRAYGDMYSWPKIWSANRELIDNPNIIEPGMELTIPRNQ